MVQRELPALAQQQPAHADLAASEGIGSAAGAAATQGRRTAVAAVHVRAQLLVLLLERLRRIAPNDSAGCNARIAASSLDEALVQS